MKKLKKILLINWLYFDRELIEVGDVNFLTGRNGAGKSTVIDALQIVLLGETNARNFNLAANERSQRTLDGYLRADMDENNPRSRRGKDFSSYIACEFYDDAERSSFVCGVMFDCRRDGSRRDHFFIYTGTLPENCFIENGEAIDLPSLRRFLPPGGGLRDPEGIPPQSALALECTYRAGVPYAEKGGLLPPDRRYPAVYHREYLRCSGQAGHRGDAAEYPRLQAS